MNFVIEIYHSMISGWHEGKGHKNKHNISLQFTNNDGITPILIECIALTYAR